LSAKFTSMNRNSRKVMVQAPLGVGCAVMAGFLVCLCRLCKIGRLRCYKGGHGQGNRGFAGAPASQWVAACNRRCPATVSRSRRVPIETVLRLGRPDIFARYQAKGIFMARSVHRRA
jgi:hypothetical protein